jgi:hypothetical protein
VGGELPGLDSGHEVDVELRKTFNAPEFRSGDASGAALFSAVVDFGAAGPAHHAESCTTVRV